MRSFHTTIACAALLCASLQTSHNDVNTYASAYEHKRAIPFMSVDTAHTPQQCLPWSVRALFPSTVRLVKYTAVRPVLATSRKENDHVFSDSCTPLMLMWKGLLPCTGVTSGTNHSSSDTEFH